MKNLILGLVLVLGCGSGQQATEQEDWLQNSAKEGGCWDLNPATDDAGAAIPKQDAPTLSESEFEFGQTAEALTVPSSYGSDNNSQRCSSSSTTCKMPFAKSVNFHEFLDTTCTGLMAPRYHASFVIATNYWKPLLEARGWKVTVNAGLPQHPENIVEMVVNCSNAATPIATTTVSFDHQSGKFLFSAYSITRLDQADIENSGFMGSTLTKQKNFISSVIEHEFGHVLGLGHFVPPVACPDRTNPSATLMVNAGCGDPTDASTYVVRTATSDELQRLNDYKP